jgi:hypothetical protein
MNSPNFARSLEPILGTLCHGIFILLLAMNIASAQSLPINMPAKPFGELPHPPAPNYADKRHWAAISNRLDAADVIPENDLFGDRQESALVDAFYIHPTTYRRAASWNQPLDDESTNQWTDESVIARQAAVFNACCRVFAPRYRQATAAARRSYCNSERLDE